MSYLIRIIRADYPPISDDMRVATVKLSAGKPGAGKDVISVGPFMQAKIKALNGPQAWAAICRDDYGPSQGKNKMGFLRLNVVAYAMNVYRILEERRIGKQLWGRVQSVSYWWPPADLENYCQLVTFQRRDGRFVPQGNDALDYIRVPLVAKKACWLLLVDGSKTYCERV